MIPPVPFCCTIGMEPVISPGERVLGWRARSAREDETEKRPLCFAQIRQGDGDNRPNWIKGRSQCS